jgi:hypothetical protein
MLQNLTIVVLGVMISTPLMAMEMQILREEKHNKKEETRRIIKHIKMNNGLLLPASFNTSIETSEEEIDKYFAEFERKAAVLLYICNPRGLGGFLDPIGKFIDITSSVAALKSTLQQKGQDRLKESGYGKYVIKTIRLPSMLNCLMLKGWFGQPLKTNDSFEGNEKLLSNWVNSRDVLYLVADVKTSKK